MTKNYYPTYFITGAALTGGVLVLTVNGNPSMSEHIHFALRFAPRVAIPSGVYLHYQLATPQVISIPRKHLGVVDLGNLNWSYASGSQFFYASTSNLNSKGADAGQLANIYCSMYMTMSKINLEVVSNTTPSISMTNDTTTNPNRLSVKNTNYTNATDFKNAMSGILSGIICNVRCVHFLNCC